MENSCFCTKAHLGYLGINEIIFTVSLKFKTHQIYFHGFIKLRTHQIHFHRFINWRVRLIYFHRFINLEFMKYIFTTSLKCWIYEGISMAKKNFEFVNCCIEFYTYTLMNSKAKHYEKQTWFNIDALQHRYLFFRNCSK